MEVEVRVTSTAPRRVEVRWRPAFHFVTSSTNYIVLVRLNDEQEWSMTVSGSSGTSLLFDATGWQCSAPTVTVMGSEIPLNYVYGGQRASIRKIKINGDCVGTASLEPALRASGPTSANYGHHVDFVSVNRGYAVATGDGGDGWIAWICRLTTSFFSWLFQPATPPPAARRQFYGSPVHRAATTSRIATVKPYGSTNYASFNNNTSARTNAIRLDNKSNVFYEIHVSCSLDESTTRLTATISWTFQDYARETPYCWQVTVVNKTWSQGDNCTYNQWLFLIDKGLRSFELPMFLRPGNRYSVSVRGLKRGDVLPNGVSEFNSVLCRGSVEFRAGPVLSMSDVQQLHNAALSYVRRKGSQSTVCTWLYRNKPRQYFNTIIKENGGRMQAHLKDAGGDLRSPINGEISGLFFGANVSHNGQPIPKSPFGDTRLLIEAGHLLNITTNVYFADFYCMKTDGPHYVILVLTRPWSEADRFCRQRLPQLNFDDKHTNPFLFRQHGAIYVANFSCHVEVFYTEEIDNVNKYSIVNNVPTHIRGSSTQGGVPKSRGCSVCDLFYGRPLMNLSGTGFERF